MESKNIIKNIFDKNELPGFKGLYKPTASDFLCLKFETKF